MNQDEPGPLLHASLEQECSAWSGAAVGDAVLAVGSQVGCGVFSLRTADTLEVVFQSLDVGAVCIAETLQSRGLLALVGIGSPRMLRLLHLGTRRELGRYRYSCSVRAVRMSPRLAAVCLEDTFFLYEYHRQDLQVLRVLRDTACNPAGICALHEDLLAYPGSTSMGTVQLLNVFDKREPASFLAHDSLLAALAFSAAGDKLATASVKGTVIRVFSMPAGQKLHEFRRGLKRCVQICSLSFGCGDAFLCTSSETETVHIFRLPRQAQAEDDLQEGTASWTSYLGTVLTSSSYLPALVTDILGKERAFATVHLPFRDLKTSCFLATIQNAPHLLVATAYGYLYVYKLDTERGGECRLLKRHSLCGGHCEPGLK